MSKNSHPALNRQVILWLDNWYRKRFSSDPQHNDMSLNVSVLAVLHITEIPVFPGYVTLQTMVNAVPSVSRALTQALRRVHGGVRTVNEEPLQTEWIRVPLDVQRTNMRSLQWLPCQLTELTAGSQRDLL